MRRRRAIPMPTLEEKERAKLKATSADPLVWAMKSVDDKFPDEREKDVETIKAEAEVEAKMGPTETEEAETIEGMAGVNDSEMLDEDLLDDEDDGNFDDDFDDAAAKEIKAEDKLAMPMDDGVVTMEVTPLRQNVSNVSPTEVKKVPKEEISESEPKAKFKFKSKVKAEGKSDEKAVDSKTQVKLMNLEFKQKKMMIGVAALAIVAVLGVCFGIIATVKQSQAAEDFVNQLAEVNANNNDDGVSNGDSIDLKDWGIKISIIDGLTNVSYNTLMDDYAEVQIWGAKKDASANYVPDFAKQSKNGTPLGTMVRVPRYERAAAGRLIWYDDYYNYYYQGPSGVPSVSEDEMSWWVESYLLIKEMLTNADNYTSIES